jgi:Cation/multidrug efflux pump
MLVIDRNTASRMGITPQVIVDALYDAFGQRQVSTMFTQLNQYRVVLEVMPEFRQGPQALQFLDVRSLSGGQVPLNVFTQVTETTTPLVVSRQGQFPAVTLSFNLAPGNSLGDAVRPSNGRHRTSTCLPASMGVFRARPGPSRLRWRTSHG